MTGKRDKAKKDCKVPDEVVSAFHTLELDTSANLAEDKSAYRSMAMQLHPDKNTSEDGEKFKHLSCAYAIIIQYIKQLQSGEYGCGSNDQQQDCEESLNMECDDEYLSEVRVQPKQQCLVLEMGALTHKFYGECAEMYGTPRDQGTNGYKFTHPMYAKNVERDRADKGAEDRKEGCHSKLYGIVHITDYHSTGGVLVQGVPYLFWLTEEFPEIRNACAENAGGALAHRPSIQKNYIQTCGHPDPAGMATD